MATKTQALQFALELCAVDMCKYCKALEESSPNPVPCLYGCETWKIAQDALAMPMRNCDVGTAEEQAQRFEKFCKKSSMSSFVASAYCAYECACKDCSCCELSWSQMPYEAEEGGAA